MNQPIRERTLQEKYSMFLSAIRANNLCKKQRQSLTLLRSSPVGKHIEPQIAHDAAISLIDCFHKIHNNNADIQKRQPALTCLMGNGNCQKQINEYATRP